MRYRSDTDYYRLWHSLEILPRKNRSVSRIVNRIVGGESKYRKVEIETKVPWVVVGIVHQMECSGRWNSCLHNGQPWNKKTTIAPIGRGPFVSWEESAIDALVSHEKIFPSFWHVPGISFFLERYNGMGYAHRKVNSPYLYSFSNHGVGVGKYGRDGHYDPNLVSRQCGAIPILKRLCELGLYPDDTYPYVLYDPGNKSKIASLHQEALNGMRYDVWFNTEISVFNDLVIDGKAGKKTSDAHFKLFGHFLYGDPRLRG